MSTKIDEMKLLTGLMIGYIDAGGTDVEQECPDCGRSIGLVRDETNRVAFVHANPPCVTFLQALRELQAQHVADGHPTPQPEHWSIEEMRKRVQRKRG